MGPVDDARLMIRKYGRTVTLRRLAGTALTATDVDCKARVDANRPYPVEGVVSQDRRDVLLDPTPAEQAGWPLPPVADDQVVIDGTACEIEYVDPKMIGDTVAFYRLVVLG